MRNTFLSLLLLTALTASSQKEKFEDGFIITQAGDTLPGLLSWKVKGETGDYLRFKRTAADTVQFIAWGQLRGVVGSDRKPVLKISYVKRTLEYIDGNDYSIRRLDSISEGYIPLNPLYTGKNLSLYYYFDKAPFYFLYDGKNMFQLVQRYRYLTRVERMFDYEKGRRLQINDEYKGLLAGYYNFAEDKKMRYILDNTLYEERGFKYLISKMDGKLK